jgi:hypothetical protein
MPTLSGSVGEGSTSNKKHDVVLVQVLLKVVKHPKSKAPFYTGSLDGAYGGGTKAAIVAFQNAFSLVAAAKPAVAPVPAGAKSSIGNLVTGAVAGAVAGAMAVASAFADKPGLIQPGGATFKKLVEQAIAVNADYGLLRALPETKFAYIEMTDADLAARIKTLTDKELESTFRDKVLALVRKTFTTHKIALAGWGDLSYRRSFADQAKVLAAGTSQAGPGESNHQFGQALDVGFVGLKYIKDNGTIGTVRNENNFDSELHGWQRVALYKARNDIWEKPPQGTGTLFRIRLKGGDNDPNHYQNFNQFPDLYPDDVKVDIRRSLADHLTHVSGMTWESKGGGTLACDLGLGGATVDVGSPSKIWAGNAGLTRHEYLTLLNAQRARSKLPALKDSDVKKADFDKAFASLKAAFEAADTRWSEWVAKDSSGTAI